MIIKTNVGLLGDTLGLMPAFVASSKIEKTYIYLQGMALETRQLYDMLPKKYKIGLLTDEDELPENEKFKEINLSKAFNLATSKKIHMTQAHFGILGYPIPDNAIRPELEFRKIDTETCDWILSPFSRSLPENQKWQQDNWNKLVDMMPDKQFIVLGNSNNDKKDYIFEKHNVRHIYDTTMENVFNLLLNARNGVLSVVTGTSHMAHALGVNNILFNNQDFVWGTNPDALCLRKTIHSYKSEEVAEILRKFDKIA